MGYDKLFCPAFVLMWFISMTSFDNQYSHWKLGEFLNVYKLTLQSCSSDLPYIRFQSRSCVSVFLFLRLFQCLLVSAFSAVQILYVFRVRNRVSVFQFMIKDLKMFCSSHKTIAFHFLVLYLSVHFSACLWVFLVAFDRLHRQSLCMPHLSSWSL